MNADVLERMCAMLSDEGEATGIVDLGYSSVADLLTAWGNVMFENTNEFT